MERKLAPTRKRPKRVAKKIAKRFGLAHYDQNAIFIRKLARVIDSMGPLVIDTTLTEVWGESFASLLAEEKEHAEDA